MPGKGAILSFKQVLMGGLFFSVSSVSFQALFIPPPNLLIIILFQEDNISGTIASLTYGSQIQKIHAFDNNKTMKMIYSMYRAGEVSVHRACCKRATQPYPLGGGGTICPVSRPAGFTTRFPRMVTKCLLTRSMLILKCINLPFQGMCLYMYIVLTVSQFHTDVHLVYLVSLFDTTILSEIMSMSNIFWWDLKSSESKEPFKFHSSL